MPGRLGLADWRRAQLSIFRVRGVAGSAAGRRLRAAPQDVGPPLVLAAQPFAAQPLAAPTPERLYFRLLKVLATHGFWLVCGARPDGTKGSAGSRLRLSATRRLGASCLAPALYALER